MLRLSLFFCLIHHYPLHLFRRTAISTHRLPAIGQNGASKYRTQPFIAPPLAFLLCRLASPLFRHLIVVIVIPLVKKNKRYEVGTVQVPIPKPAPKAVVAVDGLYLFVVRAARERASGLLSASFFGEASSSNILSALSLLSCVCLTASPTCFIESTS